MCVTQRHTHTHTLEIDINSVCAITFGVLCCEQANRFESVCVCASLRRYDNIIRRAELVIWGFSGHRLARLSALDRASRCPRNATAHLNKLGGGEPGRNDGACDVPGVTITHGNGEIRVRGQSIRPHASCVYAHSAPIGGDCSHSFFCFVLCLSKWQWARVRGTGKWDHRTRRCPSCAHEIQSTQGRSSVSDTWRVCGDTPG